MDLGRSKALFGLLSAAAVVAPASGLAWLGVRSNLAERERARASFVASNQKEARFIASSLDDEAARTLDAIAPLFGDAPLGDWLATGELHALALKTYTPAAWSAAGGNK